MKTRIEHTNIEQENQILKAKNAELKTKNAELTALIKFYEEQIRLAKHR